MGVNPSLSPSPKRLCITHKYGGIGLWFRQRVAESDDFAEEGSPPRLSYARQRVVWALPSRSVVLSAAVFAIGRTRRLGDEHEPLCWRW